MWDLINVNDSPFLTVEQLETGMATVTQTEEFFDCHPAVTAAFRLSKKRDETIKEEEIKTKGMTYDKDTFSKRIFFKTTKNIETF